jgi:tetratricopeptide (TPR) repeat protein
MTDRIGYLLCEAREHYARGNYPQAREGFIRAGRHAREAGASSLQIEALGWLVTIERREGRLQDALERNEEIVALCEGIGDRRRRATAIRQRALLLGELERLLDARIAWREARGAFEEVGAKADLIECDDWLHRLSERIHADVREERRRIEASDPSVPRRRLFGREWLR